MRERIIEAERSIIWAADVGPHKYRHIVHSLGRVAGLSAVKIGFEVGLGMGLSKARDDAVMADEGLVVIYDHQKAGNDIPDTGENFARVMAKADIDAAILFPFNGPLVEEAWIKALQDAGVGVIVGAEMTHEQQRSSESGYIDDGAFLKIFDLAVGLGVRDFVVPGNKPEKVTRYRRFLESALEGESFDLYAPGFVNQGGDISETGIAAGERWHAIVGRGISDASDQRAAAAEYARQVKGE